MLFCTLWVIWHVLLGNASSGVVTKVRLCRESVIINMICMKILTGTSNLRDNRDKIVPLI